MKLITAGIATIFTLLIATVVSVVGWDIGRSAGATHPVGVSQVGNMSAVVPTAHVYLTIATPDMLKTDVGPAVLPSAFTIPANADVTITIVNFDNATPLTGGATVWAKASGIEGTFSTEAIDLTNPNGAGQEAARTLSAVDPQLVSHTFTIPDLKINVPLLADSRTTFTFHTGNPGTYVFHCMDPCGTGDTGWSGAMSKDGYMAGKVTFA